MILIDSNVFMYAAGAEHPNKLPSKRFLEDVAKGKHSAAIDAEVLQEILHRYRSINRWKDGQLVFELAVKVVPVVIPISLQVVESAKRLMNSYPNLIARDALHSAVYFAAGATWFCSFDKDFDSIKGLKRRVPK